MRLLAPARRGPPRYHRPRRAQVARLGSLIIHFPGRVFLAYAVLRFVVSQVRFRGAEYLLSRWVTLSSKIAMLCFCSLLGNREIFCRKAPVDGQVAGLAEACCQ